MRKRLLLIVGLQKSGSTLLARLLQQTGVVESPFFGEGHLFWGNSPWEPPGAFPTGAVYYRSQGEMGHEIDARDATAEVLRILNERLAEAPVQTPIAINKNPYNTVRLPWLRAL
ncbi:MAG: sulfotransferase, partial [Pyrinomonadaceae bacterium]